MPCRQPEIDEGRKNRAMVVKEDSNGAEDFDRLSKISEYFENEEFQTNSGNFRQGSGNDGERDKKLDAMNNTAARGISLTEHLLDNGRSSNARRRSASAGEAIINNIDAEGYLPRQMETIQSEAKDPRRFGLDAALGLVQTLEPSGVGAATCANACCCNWRTWKTTRSWPRGTISR